VPIGLQQPLALASGPWVVDQIRFRVRIRVRFRVRVKVRVEVRLRATVRVGLGT